MSSPDSAAGSGQAKDSPSTIPAPPGTTETDGPQGARELSGAQAIGEALGEEMERDPTVFLMGEDVGKPGGVYKATEGLYERFGPTRVRDTPISEAGFTGLGVGAAMTGLRPVVEVMFGDFSALILDQVANQAAKAHYMSGGGLAVPMVLRTSLGAGRRLAAQHSQSLQAWFSHIPGLKVVLPSSPAELKGLLKTAIRDSSPVVFIEDKLMYRQTGPVPVGEYLIPFGTPERRRAGSDLTIVATSSMVDVALQAADTLAEQGIDAEVIDPRTLVPLDIDALVASVKRTTRCIVIDEGYRGFGATAELASSIAEGAFYHLDAPVRRIGAMDVPVPFSPALEDLTIPSPEQVVETAVALVVGHD